MERVITYKVDNPLPRQKVRGFLKCKQYSTHSLKRLRDQPESILVNGKPVFLNHMLRAGDVITVRIREEASSDQILPVCLPIDILYEDADLMIINKAAGMPVHPSQNNRDNTLGNALVWYFGQQGKSFVYRCVNRLDRDTSGLTIVAKHMVSGGILAAMTAEKTLREIGIGKERLPSVRREYLAIVEGEMPSGEGTIDAPIGRPSDPGAYGLPRISVDRRLSLQSEQYPHEPTGPSRLPSLFPSSDDRRSHGFFRAAAGGYAGGAGGVGD